MKAVWLIMLISSCILLLFVMLRNKLSFSWFRHFALHLVAAAAVLYLINFSGVVEGWDIPINPVTIGTVVLLGMPGILLVLGIKWTIY